MLVGTHLLERSNLGGPDSRQWKDVIRACKAEWRKLFLTYPRHQGETLSDYLSENAIDETAFD